MNKKKLYLISQFTGWGTYIVFAGIINQINNKQFDLDLVISLLSALVIGIGVSHLYREIIIRMGWLKLNIRKLIPRVLLATLWLGALFQFLYWIITNLLITQKFSLAIREAIPQTLTWNMLLFIWSLIYFVAHFFENYRKEEIKNLRWEAAKTESELNKLKSQLNPHFIFNSMNTIRALVDEDPRKAKKSITQLSNILRNTLMMGRKKVIPFEEELNLVRDYLEIEKARFEERLNVEWSIDPTSKNFEVPPLMIQTLVENGIKHGISKLTEGGSIHIQSKVLNDKLYVVIHNDGNFAPSANGSSGFGLVNTRQRLQLLYGPDSTFNIYNLDDNTVNTEFSIPAKTLNP